MRAEMGFMTFADANQPPTRSPAMDPLHAAIVRANDMYALFAPGDMVVVGVSGGPDSTALLHSLAALRDDLGICLTAGHMDHGIRGAESAADAEYVARLCESQRVTCRIERADVPLLRASRRLSMQEAARQVRHAFLRSLAQESGAACIALGHTADDRIETLVLNILRGTGIEGLAALRPARRPIVRPLIGCRRRETLDYCARYELDPRFDSSNDHTDYRRNRIRAELLPHLVSYYNEKAGEAILRLGELASADNDLLEQLAAEALEAAAERPNAREILLPRASLLDLPVALRRRVLRGAIAEARGSRENLDLAVVDRILQAAADGERLSLDIAHGYTAVPVRVTVAARFIRAALIAESVVRPPWTMRLACPGITALPQCGREIEVVLGIDANRAAALAAGGMAAYMFREADVVLPLVARSRKAGDRIRPRGLGGTRKLQDLFTNRRVPADERSLVPVIVDDTGTVLVVAGLEADERALRSGTAAAPIDGDTGPFVLILLRETDR